jgi:DAACS family dicarboxylate/amino acid:cation (Na+ or H+) symporter
MKTHHRLLIALGLGALLGTLAHPYADSALLAGVSRNLFEPLGQVFLRLIFMIVVPMVFCGLVLGAYQLSSHHGLGRVVSRTLLFTVLASTASVLIGVTLVNLVKPGSYVQISGTALESQVGAATGAVEKIQGNAKAAKPFMQAFVELIPRNPLEAAVKAFDGEMLALMVFALIFGFAISSGTKPGEGAGARLTGLLEEIYDVCLKIVGYAMKLAPYAVFALVFNSTFKFGHTLLMSLAVYVLVVIAGLAIQQFGVYAILLKTLGKRSPWAFFKECRDVYVYAFATASSNATLPKSLELAETRLGVPPAISRFVLTVGSTANQNGTALFEGITVLFLAQVYGVDLSFAQQCQVVVMSILAGVGTAGVPGGSLPLIMILLQQVGIPPEGLGLVLGVDRLLDMCRTTVNVSGDLVITALVSGPGEGAGRKG